jgi:phospholipase/carboxylesterase/glyoxalase family protein
MTVATEQLGFIHNFAPSETDRRAKTLLLLHGTGGCENDLIMLGKSLDQDAHLLSPRGKVLENGLPRFFRRFSEGVFDVEDLKFRTRELADFIEKASVAYDFNFDKVIAVGFSNGANIAASLLLLFPRLLAGAVLFRPMVPIEPAAGLDLDNVPVLILSGRNDTIVPDGQPETLARLLEKAGADVNLLWQEAGHSITTEEVLQANKWLKLLTI